MSIKSAKKLHTFLGHNDSVYALAQTDEDKFLSAGGDGMIIQWDLQHPDEGVVVAKVSGSVYALAHDAPSGSVYVGQNNDGIQRIDLNERASINSIHLGTLQIFDIKIIDDQVWAGLSNGEVVVLSKELQVIKRVKFTDERVRNIDLGNNEVAIAFSDNVIRIVDRKTLEVNNELRGHSNSVFFGTFHPSGKYLLSGGRDAQLKVWDSHVDYVLRESIAAHLYTVNDGVFSDSGRYFFTCSMDKSIKVWDAHNFKLLKVLDKHRHSGHGNSVNKLLWMNYRDLLVTCSDDRSISVWEIKFAE